MSVTSRYEVCGLKKEIRTKFYYLLNTKEQLTSANCSSLRERERTLQRSLRIQAVSAHL
ncbi:hypothetical protein ABR775_14740 [Bacillus cereus]|uniref:hypothetical protein n=1 Tax=Bacillus cereus TaxID=1396 RepID=UPI0015C641AC|nr:hypothetical protein [Bacillus cereus]HDR4695463.1 hypothetical protein [Bacillus cereus]